MSQKIKLKQIDFRNKHLVTEIDMKINELVEAVNALQREVTFISEKLREINDVNKNATTKK